MKINYQKALVSLRAKMNISQEELAQILDLAYQKDAVKQARKIIEKHGGVFISDVVGLGKT